VGEGLTLVSPATFPPEKECLLRGLTEGLLLHGSHPRHPRHTSSPGCKGLLLLALVLAPGPPVVGHRPDGEQRWEEDEVEQGEEGCVAYALLPRLFPSGVLPLNGVRGEG